MATSLIAGTTWEFEDPDSPASYLTINGIQTAPELRTQAQEVTVTAINDTVEKTRPGLDSPSEFEIEMQDFSKAGDVDVDQEKLVALAIAETEDVPFKVNYVNGRTAAFTGDVKNFGSVGGGASDLAKIKMTIKRTSPITWGSPV